MKDLAPQSPPLRDPNRVMRLAHMGSVFPTRLSFLRILLRQLMADRAAVTEHTWQMDADGFGHAVFTIPLQDHTYSLVAVTQPLAPEDRTDRVIAEKWDAAFVLFDGVPDAADIARIRKNAPLQEAGRFGPKDLCLSRANKSVRLFDAIMQARKANAALPLDDIRKVGYLMRTTAVYGNGKFGLADRSDFAGRPAMAAPFMAEMLTVFLIRHFTHRLIEHLSGTPLPADVRRYLGIGNSTGLGMAPFLVSHPLLLHSWVACRETAFERVLNARPTTDQAATLVQLAAQITQHLAEWNVPDVDAQSDIDQARADWAGLMSDVTAASLQRPGALETLWNQARDRGAQAEELCLSWMAEGFPELVDGLAECLANPFTPELEPAADCAAVRDGLMATWPGLDTMDFNTPDAVAQFWYVSEAKMEPRLGQRATDPGADCESPLDVARRVQALLRDLDGATGPVWRFLLTRPHHRDAMRRVQALLRNPYSEIRDNLIHADTAPIDMLRFKLAMFGASKFDPKSKLWTRITLFAGAPLAEDIAAGTAVDRTWMPVFQP